MTSYATKLTHHDGQFVARTVYVYEHWSRQEALHYFRGLKTAKDEGHIRRWWDGDTMHEELHLSGKVGEDEVTVIVYEVLSFHDNDPQELTVND